MAGNFRVMVAAAGSQGRSEAGGPLVGVWADVRATSAAAGGFGQTARSSWSGPAGQSTSIRDRCAAAAGECWV